MRGVAASAAAVLLVGAGQVVPMVVLAQTPPIECAPGSTWDPAEGRCVISVQTPGDPGRGGGGGAPPERPPGGGGGSAAPVEPPPCQEPIVGEEVPCELGGWRWVPGWNAYARLADPQPPTSDPIWEGNTDGAIYDRGIWLGNPALDPGFENQGWSMDLPWELPDPLVLAQQAITSMDLEAIDIGIVPEDLPGRVGLVGLPTWMWAASPGQDTMGPITRSASAAGYTVTATGRVRQVVWDMGDGTVVTCAGPGTPYADEYLDADSPTCGHRYTKAGEYQVSATSSWVIDWAGMGQSGTVPLSLERQTSITVGEVQVLSQNP